MLLVIEAAIFRRISVEANVLRYIRSADERRFLVLPKLDGVSARLFFVRCYFCFCCCCEWCHYVCTLERKIQDLSYFRMKYLRSGAEWLCVFMSRSCFSLLLSPSEFDILTLSIFGAVL